LKKVVIPIIIAAVIIGIGVTIAISLEPEDPRELITPMEQFPNQIRSGPVILLEKEIELGEPVYVWIRGLDYYEAGKIHFVTPKGVIYKTIQYDGSTKSDFNQYFDPETFYPKGICTYEDLIGTWKVEFEPQMYEPLEFELIGTWLNNNTGVFPTDIC